MKKNLARLGALSASTTLAFMATGPAWAAPVVASADANAVTLSIAGNATGSGEVTATNDGSGEDKQGETTPPISVLGNQDLLNAGVLQQDAAAQVQDGVGVSAACAGVAGEGGSVAQVGDSSCIFPGQPVGVTIANLDLTGAVLVDPESALADLNAIGDPLMQQLVGPLTAALSEGLAPLGETGLVGRFSVVEERCVASPGAVEASADLVDAQLTLSVAGESVPVVNLPAHPAPNTKVVTDLDQVVNLAVDAVEVDLRTTLDAALADLTGVTDELQTQIVDTLVAEVSDNLQPVEDNILDITLNAQSRPAADAIKATALDLELLPAAAEVADSPLVDLQLGNVECGPNGVLQAAATPPSDNGGDGGNDGVAGAADDLPEVPTVVDAGAGEQAPVQPALAAGVLALAGVSGLVGYRRLVAGR